MKVVLDANVFVSFLLTHGTTTSNILEAWKTKTFTLLVSKEILFEIEEVLGRFVKGKLIERKAASALLRRLKREGKLVAVSSIVTASPDRKDNRYLACAKDEGADFLVTRDTKDLLLLKRFGKTKIVSPKEFIDMLQKRKKFTE